MTDKTMTLEGVRDDLERLGYKGYAEVITRHLSQTAALEDAVRENIERLRSIPEFLRCSDLVKSTLKSIREELTAALQENAK